MARLPAQLSFAIGADCPSRRRVWWNHGRVGQDCPAPRSAPKRYGIQWIPDIRSPVLSNNNWPYKQDDLTSGHQQVNSVLPKIDLVSKKAVVLTNWMNLSLKVNCSTLILSQVAVPALLVMVEKSSSCRSSQAGRGSCRSSWGTPSRNSTGRCSKYVYYLPRLGILF